MGYYPDWAVIRQTHKGDIKGAYIPPSHPQNAIKRCFWWPAWPRKVKPAGDTQRKYPPPFTPVLSVLPLSLVVSALSRACLSAMHPHKHRQVNSTETKTKSEEAGAGNEEQRRDGDGDEDDGRRRAGRKEEEHHHRRPTHVGDGAGRQKKNWATRKNHIVQSASDGFSRATR